MSTRVTPEYLDKLINQLTDMIDTILKVKNTMDGQLVDGEVDQCWTGLIMTAGALSACAWCLSDSRRLLQQIQHRGPNQAITVGGIL